MRKGIERVGKKRKENKLVDYRIKTCRRVLISLYQVGARTFVT
jgi:hypothetical protein